MIFCRYKGTFQTNLIRHMEKRHAAQMKQDSATNSSTEPSDEKDQTVETPSESSSEKPAGTEASEASKEGKTSSADKDQSKAQVM